jgi:hypothetical protein
VLTEFVASYWPSGFDLANVLFPVGALGVAAAALALRYVLLLSPELQAVESLETEPLGQRGLQLPLARYYLKRI